MEKMTSKTLLGNSKTFFFPIFRQLCCQDPFNISKEVKKRLKTKSHVKIGNKKNKTENKSMNKKKHTTGTYPCGQCGGLWADENAPKKDEDFVACVTRVQI